MNENNEKSTKEIKEQINQSQNNSNNEYEEDEERKKIFEEQLEKLKQSLIADEKLKTSFMEYPDIDIEKLGDENVHAGHKSRLRKKALAHIEMLAEHEVLEILLNFGVVRKNTNPLAHNLINKYGSLVEVMETSYYDLLKEPGVGEISASLLTLIPKMIHYYNQRKLDLVKSIKTIGEAIEVFKALFSIYDHEVLFVACLGEEGRLLALEKLGEGSRNQIDVNLPKILKFILKHNPQKVILAHNHLSNSALPSISDMKFTIGLQEMLTKLSIELKEHFVLCQTDEYSSLVAKTIKKEGKDPVPLPEDLL